MGSSNAGTELAPEALFKGGLGQALKYNGLEYDQISLKARGDLSKKEPVKNQAALIDLNKQIYNEAVKSLKKGRKVITLGGDHSVAIGSIYAAKEVEKEALLVYVDAHPDANDQETSPSGNMHGMSFSTVLGDGLHKNFGYKPYKKNDALLLGIKDIDPAEWQYIKENKIKFFTIENIIELGISNVMKKVIQFAGNKPIHLSLDIDVVDAEYAPGTGVINKGGLTYREIKYICKKLSTANIRSIDVVEVNPKKDRNNKTVELSNELLITLLGGEWSPYNQYIEEEKLKNK